MARYRVNNTYLSEEEYRQYQDRASIDFWSFIGAVLAGYLAYRFTVPLEWEKWLRFIVVIVAAFAGGGVLAALRVVLNKTLEFFLHAALLGVAGYVLWLFL